MCIAPQTEIIEDDTQPAAQSQLASDQSAPSQSAQGRFTSNLAASLFNFLFSVAAGIWFVPFLIHHLGMAAYGLVPLAVVTTSYFAVITLALNAAIGRFLILAREQGDDVQANRIFNTSLWGSLLLTGLLLLPGGWAALHVERFLRVPPGLEPQARLLFLFTFAAFLLNEVKAPFDVASFCRNRFDLRSLFSTGETLVRVGVAALLLVMVGPGLQLIGIGIFAASLFSFFGALLLWRRLMPDLSICLGQFDWGTLRALTATGTWVTLNQIGTILFLSIDLIVVNRLFGSAAGGQYAVVIQWSVLLRTLAGTITGLFVPTVMMLYGRGDRSGLVRYMRQAVKGIGLVLALPVGLICGLSGPLLLAWVGPHYISLSGLLVLVTFHLCFNLGYLPLHAVSMAANKVRVPAIVQMIMGAFNLALSLFLARDLHWGLYGIAAAGAIALTSKNVIFTPLYGAYILGLPWFTFIREMLPIAAATALIVAFCRVISLFWSISGIPELISVALLVSAIYLAGVYFLWLSKQERSLLTRSLPF